MSAEPGKLSVLNFYLKLGAAYGLRIHQGPALEASEQLWRVVGAQWTRDREDEETERECRGTELTFRGD